MNMKQFRYALVLAGEGSFSRAAETLGISQPSLSQYIKKLETELNVTLFTRTGGNVRLTDAGQVYLDAGRRILDTERQMLTQFADLNDNRTGSIVIGIAPTRCQYLIPEIARKFRDSYPGMHLVIEERFLGSLIEDAERGAFDLCVATLPVDESKFCYRLMMHEEIVLAVPIGSALCNTLDAAAAEHPGRLYPAIDARMLSGADYISLTETQPTQALLNDLCNEHGISVHVSAECMSIETQFSMVKAGIGAALIPSSLSKYTSVDSVRYFSLTQALPRRDMAVIYRKEQYLSKAVTDLIEIMTSI